MKHILVHMQNQNTTVSFHPHNVCQSSKGLLYGDVLISGFFLRLFDTFIDLWILGRITTLG